MNQATYRTVCTRFLWSVGVIFIITGLAKLFSAMGQAKILSSADPVIGLSNRQVMSGVGVLELALAVYLFKGRSLIAKLGLSSWMVGNILAYRLILGSLHLPPPCSCLGTITDNLPLSPETVGLIMKGLLGYMFTGCSLMVILGVLQWKAQKGNLQKLPC